MNDNFKSDKKKGPVFKRHEQILKLVREQGFMPIETLAKLCNVTPQTIRSDINLLSKKGWLYRYHGGTGLPLTTENVAYTDRQVLCLREKQLIAKMVAQYIPDHASLFINIGTTNEEIAKALRYHKQMRVITNNLNIAFILSNNENFEVIITGGLVRSRDQGVIGEATIDFIQQFKVDYGIIGISGIDEDGVLLDFDYREVRVARAIIENSRKVFLATDHTKFGRNAMVRLGKITDIDALFTDIQPPAKIRELMADTDVNLHVACPDNYIESKIEIDSINTGKL